MKVVNMYSRIIFYGLLNAMFWMEIILIIDARSIDTIPYLAGKISQFEDVPRQNLVIMDGNRKSFPDALREMDLSVQNELDKKSCKNFHPQKPNFNIEGRRISEMKCLDYVWRMKTAEAEQNLANQCPGLTAIVGGKYSKQGEYRHMGAIGWKGIEEGTWEFRCGGSLISERFVLTAAHCRVNDKNKTPDIVRFGVVNLTDAENALDKKIAKFIRHSRYIPGYKNYDIAVIKLANKVRPSANIQPACILNQHNVNEAIITGWGAISEEKAEEGVISNELLVAEVNVLPAKECRKRWRQKRDARNWKSYFVKEQICATRMDGVADICAGDSGSPLQTELHVNTNRSIHNIVGVTAFNYECGSHNFPSVYTNVNFHLDWIEQEVWGVKNIKASTENVNNGAISNGDEVEPSQIVQTSTTESGYKMRDIQHFDNGYLFSFETPQGGSQWNFINKYELARIIQENELHRNSIEGVENNID